MDKFTTDIWGDTLVVFSAERLNNDDEPQILGIAVVKKYESSDGHFYIETKTEIRPYCEPDEIKAVQKILSGHVDKNL